MVAPDTSKQAWLHSAGILSLLQRLAAVPDTSKAPARNASSPSASSSGASHSPSSNSASAGNGSSGAEQCNLDVEAWKVLQEAGALAEAGVIPETPPEDVNSDHDGSPRLGMRRQVNPVAWRGTDEPTVAS
jgi:hypothetical protein